MSLKLVAKSSDPPTGALILSEIVSSEGKINISVSWSQDWKGSGNVQLFDKEGRLVGETNNDVARYLARTVNVKLYGGNAALERTEVDHWLSFSIGPLRSSQSLNESLAYLDRMLMPKTWLVAKQLTIADICVFSSLSEEEGIISDGKYPNIARWYKQILFLPATETALDSISKNRIAPATKINNPRGKPAEKETKGTQGSNTRKQEGKFIELPGAEMGKVVVRFPPEASGYLHIGHAKAALLNQYYAETFQGQLIMRFDDTNPAKENVEFEKAILEDLEMLQIKPDRFTHSSDYFDLMLMYCDQLIKEGKAFVDDTPAQDMKDQRDQRLPSVNRENSVEKNMKLWEEMKIGTPKGQECCVRAKIDYQSANGCLRDPTIYRCKPEPHPRTGTKYKVYPTYDFACPIVDAVEGVTHTLRTTEYHDRDAQFYWFIEALGLNRPYIWEYSRLNMTNTVLSKRRLTWFVAEGLVDGWDDPRFPTVRGILRRGMTVEGLKQFIIAQGSSRSVVFMEWDKIWSFNKKVIDPVAVRYTALNSDELVPVKVEGAKHEWITVQNHPKDSSIGTKKVRVSPNILIEKVDAEALVEGQNATFINWGNLLIRKVKREQGSVIGVEASLNLDNKDFKNTLKLTWLSAQEDESKDTVNSKLVPCYGVYFDHIISKPVLGKDEDFKNYVAKETRKEVQMVGETELKRVKKGEIIQLQRKGFFRCDVPYAPANAFSSREQPLILFHIPDGHAASPISQTASNTAEKNTQPTKQKNDDVIAKQNEKIVSQGNKVRDLKNAKADKATIDAEVKILLDLKAEYKSLTGTDWKPGAPLKSETSLTPALKMSNTNVNDLFAQIQQQQNKIDEEAKKLSSLKAEYQKATGQDWKPGATLPVTKPSSLSATDLLNKIANQGEKVRELKSQKADKAKIDQEVKELLSLKAEYKSVTGQDWKPSATPPVKVATSNSNDSLSNEIAKQGEKVRELKSQKADKAKIDQEVKELLRLKAEYKSATGQDWKPGATPPVKVAASNSNDSLSNEIAKQGEKVRELKSQKADKAKIDQEVKELLRLKAEYKSATGQDWKPGATPPVKVAASNSNDSLSNEIAKQGETVRELKSQKADEAKFVQEVKELLRLKAEYKSATGQDWKADATPPVKVAASHSSDSLSNEIAKQGETVRELKSQKADKAKIDQEVKELLRLKAEYKSATGQDWKPVANTSAPVLTSSGSNDSKINEISNKITQQGDKVRQLKSAKAEKNLVDQEVKTLLNLKEEYKAVAGQEWKPLFVPSDKKGNKAENVPKASAKDSQGLKLNEKAMKKSKKEEKASKEDTKTGTRLGLEAKKSENLSDWYSQVITKSEMIEYYNVSGCYVLRPWSFSIWEVIRNYIDQEIKKLGVENCYFPIFVSQGALEREKTHIADFAPEVAWVTKSGDSDLAEPIAIRPTSETVMYPAYAKWLSSYRDLPLKLNQWNNVVRWEFKHPQPFLRTREFLWQEGHSAFASKAEAVEEVMTILNIYASVYEDLLAIPVVRGRKTEKEKFAGGDYTTTVEAFISASGRAIQGATSHHLGQNFSKMFDIQVEGAEEGGEKTFVYQNSWGLTTRTIGVMVMVHADDKGLVLPPNVACIQAVIVPCGVTASTTQEQRQHLLSECEKLEQELKKAGNLRIKGDYRDNYSPGWKFNHWELKGVPLRIELGPKDLEKKQVTLVRRDTAERLTKSRADAYSSVSKLLEEIQFSLFNKAKEELTNHIKQAHEWGDFCSQLDRKNLVLAPFCGEISCEDNIKADSTREDAADEPGAPSMGAKSLCIPFVQPENDLSNAKCVHKNCQNKPIYYTLFGRSY